MMRFLPSFLAVELMRNGATPLEAARQALARITLKYPKFFGGLIVLSKSGEYAAACNGMDEFPYSIAYPNTAATVKNVKCGK